MVERKSFCESSVDQAKRKLILVATLSVLFIAVYTNHSRIFKSSIKRPSKSDLQATSASNEKRVERTHASPLVKESEPQRNKDGSLTVESACSILREKPAPFDRCARNETTQQCLDGHAVMTSQYGQDYYLYATHFRYLDRPGVYVDVAANEPVFISNTWFFDTCLNWKGVCVEAHPKLVNKLKTRRSCDVVPTCVDRVAGKTVPFVLAGGFGGIQETNKNMEAISEGGKWAYEYEGMINLTCTTLGIELAKLKVHKIDYLSVDVEGHELAMFEGLDWKAVTIDVITLELSRNRTELLKLLDEKGFERKEVTRSSDSNHPAMSGDELFVRRGVVWGQPK